MCVRVYAYEVFEFDEKERERDRAYAERTLFFFFLWDGPVSLHKWKFLRGCAYIEFSGFYFIRRSVGRLSQDFVYLFFLQKFSFREFSFEI